MVIGIGLIALCFWLAWWLHNDTAEAATLLAVLGIAGIIGLVIAY